MGKCNHNFSKILFVALVVIVSLVSPQNAFAQNDAGYKPLSFPLKNHLVVRGFVAPTTFYSAGHRGTDFYASKGTSVFSAADGIVIFAGRVAGQLHVTVQHGKDLKSSYTFLATKTVKVGDAVIKGQQIGTTGGGYPPASTDSFLFTLRLKGQYVDPMLYLSGKMPIREIRLGEIKKTKKSTFQKIVSIEKMQLKKLFKAGNDFPDWFMNSGSSTLNRNISRLGKSYEKAHETIQQMKDVISRIKEDANNGYKNKVKSEMLELKNLEKKLIKYSKSTFESANALRKLIAKYYAIALDSGIETAKWFLRTIGDIAFLPMKNALAMQKAIADLLFTGGTTSLKLLNQYATYDIPTVIRALVMPGTCLLSKCTKAIQLKCDPKASFKIRSSSQGYVGSKNKLMVVSGINTSGQIDTAGKMEATVRVPIGDLGYEDDEVTYFSYAGNGKSFDKEDTYQDLNISAKKMDEQIRSWNKENPGQTLDLITHSLGGAVFGLWLADYYDPLDLAYPQIGNVVLLAPPVTGTALATAGNAISSNDDGASLRDFVASKINSTINAEAVKQLDENGYVENQVKNNAAMKKLKVHTIRASTDLIVTSGSESATGADEILLNEFEPKATWLTPAVLPLAGGNVFENGKEIAGTHSDMVSDEKTVSTVQHILEGSKPPCESIKGAMSSVIYSSLIHSTEVYMGDSINNVADAGATADHLRFMDSVSGN